MEIHVTAKGFVTCEKDDPEVNICIQQAIQTAIPNLVKGE